MTIVNGINGYAKMPANYNAVKIKIDNPVTNIPEGFKPSSDDSGIYNAVDLEINRPAVNVYKPSTAPSTAEYPINGLNMHIPNFSTVPVAYMTNYIHNRTMVNAEFEFENKNEVGNDSEPVIEDVEAEELSETVDLVDEEEVVVPEPNFTTVEAEKEEALSDIVFHGINFRGSENVSKIEIVPAQEIKPEVDINAVTKKLNDSSYDVQAQQMEEIAKIAMENPKSALPYIVTDVFASLIDVINKDTTELTPPSAEQIDTRRKIIVNEIVKEQAKEKGEDVESLELPYNLSKEEIAKAMNLSSMEQAERNKEYALYTIAILDKVFVDEVKEQTGNTVPLTDLPGISSVVDSLRHSENGAVKMAAIDSLLYIRRPEYNDELKSILSIAAKDSDEMVSSTALLALMKIEDNK